MAGQPETVSVCLATYRRNLQLSLLLADLASQTRKPDTVVVVDNDASGAARVVVEAHRAAAATAGLLLYKIQPQKNISITRNWTVEHAHGDWLAFIDDDERAPTLWLQQLLQAAAQHRADVVLAPVIPQVPEQAPAWIRRGDFYSFPRMATGTLVPPNRLRFGNVLLRHDWLARTGIQFDPAFGVTGGEDCDLLVRLRNAGARIVWCDEAIVQEPVEEARLNLKWLLRRALRGGQEFGRNTWQGRYAPITPAGRAGYVAEALLKLTASVALSALELPLGRHRAAARLMQCAANYGKLSVLWGAHYREYR